jgi:hypothetical protein
MFELRVMDDTTSEVRPLETRIPGDARARLTERQFAGLALRFAGDNGMTEEGTAEAMEWSRKVSQSAHGATFQLGSSKYYVINMGGV